MNETLSRLKRFLKRPFFTDPRTLLWLWLLLALGSALIKFHKCNNFLIFKYVFWHTWNQTSLYAPYAEYFDTNHYGPFFSLIIAPFAVVPLPVGAYFVACVDGFASLCVYPKTASESR